MKTEETKKGFRENITMRKRERERYRERVCVSERDRQTETMISTGTNKTHRQTNGQIPIYIYICTDSKLSDDQPCQQR